MPNTNYLDQMNVKANEQDTVGTDFDLRDKDLNAADAKTSVASTDNVVLKGTDGSYHTIDKSSFTEAVRGVLGGILNNMTSKGTAVKGVGVIDNSNDFGLTTPSDLATVLGALEANGSLTENANNIFRNGVWCAYGGGTNKGLPHDYGILICLRAVKTDQYYYALQLYISRGDAMYFRSAGVGLGYSNWRQIDATELT